MGRKFYIFSVLHNTQRHSVGGRSVWTVDVSITTKPSSRRRNCSGEISESSLVSLLLKIARLAEYFKKHQNQSVHFERTLEHYFDLIYWHEGQKDEKFLYARERTDVINREISFCGYFVIITSAEMLL